MLDASAETEMLDHAILGLLCRIPLRWEPLDTDRLTKTEQEALKLLTAAGMVERRFSLRLRFMGHPTLIEVELTATGEAGLAQAADPVVQAAWDLWKAEYTTRKEPGSSDPPPRFHCEKVGAEQTRLTDQGELAIRDMAAGNTQVVLGFVCRRGLPFSVRPPVDGEGRADFIRFSPASSPQPEITEVRVTNLAEVTGPLAGITNLLNKMFEDRARQPQDPSPASSAGTERNPARSATYTVAALREMTELTSATLNQYAKAAGVQTPGVGQRNFRYSEPDVRRILETIIEMSSETTVRERCRAALESLSEIEE
ncbi:MAG: hypothetical protein KA354_04160 [Phycisphaerae bacterium]|nr:hypothetical protein [Phycisphaerae bacterium]